MSTPQTRGAAAASATTEAIGLLDQVIGATKQTEPDRAQELVRTLIEEALKGTVKFDRTLVKTVDRAIQGIDRKLSEQLNQILHNERFLKLEGSWRGLKYLVMNSETGTNLKLRMLQLSKKELGRDLQRANEFDQSHLFKKIHDNEFGMPGGEPYGALIGDYEWTAHPDDVETLRLVAGVSASAFAPFISGVGPSMFGIGNWRELPKQRDLAKIFQTSEYIKWRAFREVEESRFVSLAMPRVLARLPYGAATKPVEEFCYEEVSTDDGTSREMDHDHYCWMNAAYVMGARLTYAFAKTGFCTAIRGPNGGGKVENLPMHKFVSEDGDDDTKCPTEIGIDGRRDKELSDLGFLSLSHYKRQDYAVFFGAQSVHKPPTYDKADANANAAISARLPFVMATSRFAHCLKVMARDMIGGFHQAGDCETSLNRWIQKYVNPMEGGGEEVRAKFPLRDAKIEVTEIPGHPGSYNAVAHLRPWLHMEELTMSMRMVARIPQKL